MRRNREPGLGKWSLSGGCGALRNEPDPELAILKEVYSDFGTDMVDPKIFFVEYTADPEATLHLYFHGELSGEPKIRSVKTIKELKWFPLQEISEIDLAFKHVDMDVIELFRDIFHLNFIPYESLNNIEIKISFL